MTPVPTTELREKRSPKLSLRRSSMCVLNFGLNIFQSDLPSQSMIRKYLQVKGFLPRSSRSPKDGRSNLAEGRAKPQLPCLPTSADLDTVTAYLELKHAGPDKKVPLLFWQEPMAHEWNICAIRIIKANFFVYLKENELTSLVALIGEETFRGTEASISDRVNSIVDVEKAITSKLQAHRSDLQTQIRIVDKLKRSTEKEVIEFLEKRFLSSKVRVRRSARKKLVSQESTFFAKIPYITRIFGCSDLSEGTR